MNGGSIASEGLYPNPERKKADPTSRKLALGILLQAFRDIVSPRRSTWKKGEDWKADAFDWFASDSIYPGSFCWVCHMLQISPSEIRRWLRQYQQSGEADRKRLARKLVRFQIPRIA